MLKIINGEKVPVLSGIDLKISKQAITAFIGPSGAGKSTLLRLFNRLEDPTGGMIYFKEQPITSYDVLELRRRVGMVFQIPVMFPGTVAENIHYAAKFNHPAGRMRPVRELLEMVGLEPSLAERRAEQLSVGQQQRVAFARSLATNPEVLLLDEPTASLDPTSAAGILELLKRLCAGLGLTAVLITHLLQQAEYYSDYTAFLEKGRLLEFNSSSELFNNPRRAETRNFLAGGGVK